MASLPHYRSPSVPLDVIVEALGGLDLRDDSAPGAGGKNVAGIHNHQAIAPENIPLFIHGPDPVRIAVIANPHIRPGFFHGLDQVLEILHNSRVRMMVGEPAVQLAEESCHPAAHLLQSLLGYQRSSTVATVNHDMKTLALYGRKVLLQIGEIVLQQRVIGHSP